MTINELKLTDLNHPNLQFLVNLHLIKEFENEESNGKLDAKHRRCWPYSVQQQHQTSFFKRSSYEWNCNGFIGCR